MSKYASWKNRQIIKMLTGADPKKMVSYGEKLLMKAFHRAADRMPAYRDILRKRGVDAKKITSFEDFKKHVPIITKDDVFPNYGLRQLCVDGRLDLMKIISTSSGTSDIFSFGIFTDQGHSKTARLSDAVLDYAVKTSTKKTFILNCNPMGVQFPFNMPHANTCVNTDMALAIYEKIRGEFEQAIFIGEIHFIKKLLEDGLGRGVDWKKANIHIITGADWMPESMRNYFASILGTDWNCAERAMIFMNMGLAELETVMAHESIHTVRIRRAAEADEALRRDLFGDVKICPELLHYYPANTYIESAAGEDGSPELVYSMIGSTSLVPLIRYNSRDGGSVMPYNKLKQILEKHGRRDLIPDLKLPLVALYGRTRNHISLRDKTVSSQEVRSALYKDFELASKTTGNFLMKSEDGRLIIEIQLKEKVLASTGLKERWEKLFSSLADTEVRPVPFYEFKQSLIVNYEKKFRHI